MKTGEHLKIRSFGDNVMGVSLEGNPKKPEPIYFRVSFPGGDVDIARTEDGDNWIHVRVNKEGAGMFSPGEDIPGKIVDGRLDIIGKHASETNTGDFDNPDLYHLAVRVTTKR